MRNLQTFLLIFHCNLNFLKLQYTDKQWVWGLSYSKTQSKQTFDGATKWLTMGCHLLLIDKASGLGWSLNNPCSFMILGLNLACLGDQPQKVSCCRLSLLVLFLLGLKSWLFSLVAGLKEVDEVELLRFRPLKSLLTSTSMSFPKFKCF